MQWHRDGYAIDDDRHRLDMPAIIGWLRDTYWAGHRAPDDVRRSWDNAALVFGLYAGAELVGCCRVVTDFVAVAYLADVFLAPEHRDKGLGRWLVETAVAHPAVGDARWLLHTKDAHGLYAQLGFVAFGPRIMERPRVTVAEKRDGR
jgi:GNAT superfamily N-acetyltransferase